MRLLKFLIIPLFLTFGYLLLLSYPYFFSKINRYDSLGPLSVVDEKSENLQKTLSPQRSTDEFDNHLLKGEKITSKVKATENNFGILLFRFAKLSGKVSDLVIFRIKKEGEDKWHYENTYKANQFQPDQYFTFGFPQFENAKNNTYIFEIESLSGTYENGIGVSLTEPQVALVYKYSRDDLKKLDTLSSFISKKFMYVVRNANFLQNWQILATFIFPFLFVLFMKKNGVLPGIVRFFLNSKKRRKILKVLGKEIDNFSEKTIRWFTSTKSYSLFLNTNTKKRIVIGLLIFLIALTYRFSASLVNQDKLFYAGLGGQGDYDQFIRAATCALNFCSWILHQNLLIESSILGTFYEIFGFAGGLKAYLYLMLIVSSIIAILPYVLLSRKSWFTAGGIIGGLFLATSDFLTQVALNFPPDNGSLFTFSMFFLVYLLTMHFGTIRWLLLFGLTGFFDGMFKALFLINDLVAFVLFSPVFFYEKAKQSGKSMFRKKNIKILFLSLIPLLVFLILYSSWEYLVHIKFSAYYFLRGLLLSRGESYVIYTSFDDASFAESLLSQFLYLSVSAIVMIKRLIQYADLQMIFLAPIFLGMIFLSFLKLPHKIKFPVIKFFLFSIYSIVIIILLTLIKNDYFNIHHVFAGEYIIENWTTQTYIGIFLFAEIIILFILNFGYQSLKLSLPIIPYVIMLIILTKNSPFPRISTQVVAWAIILFAFLIDWIIINFGKFLNKRTTSAFSILILILFLSFYIAPKTITMTTQLNSGLAASQSQAAYLSWVEGELPSNAVILAGGESDLVTVAENIKRPIIYSTLFSTAVLIRPNQIPGVTPADFGIISELKSRDNFKKNTYTILEDDIHIWRDRINGVADGVFSKDLGSLSNLHADDYSIEVYKFNPTLNKAIYELNIRDAQK